MKYDLKRMSSSPSYGCTRGLFAAMTCAGLFLFWIWCSMALYFSNLSWVAEWLRILVACIFGLSFPVLLFYCRKHYWRAWICMFGTGILILAWHLLIPPSHNRDWTPDVAVLPYAKINGNIVTIHNIRNFDYRSETDFTPRYYDKTVDMNKLKSIDYILSYWDGNKNVAHTIISYGFDDGYQLAVSIETRREKGEPQGALRGIFRQYELIYILADERDMLRLRTDFRKEQVYVFPLRASHKEIKKLFMETISRVNSVYKKPEFYDTITRNCLTTLINDFSKIWPRKKAFDMRMILNGRSAEMGYENGNIITELSFEETKKKCHANQYLKDGYKTDDYSKLIRHPLTK